jgi:hypothetical protein
MTYPKLGDLVNSMKGVPTTNQWDVVCSYNEDHLNALLKQRYDAGKLAKEVTLSAQREDPITEKAFTIAYDLYFDSPILSFMEGNPGFCQLTMPIKRGSYSILSGSDSRTVQLPPGKFSVVGTIPLAVVTGSTDDAAKEHSDVITFADGTEQRKYVVIHFKNAKGATYKIMPEPDPADKDPMVIYFLPVLNNYFTDKIAEIDYKLAEVNNTQNTDISVFTPQAFAFTSMGRDELGILSLYIQTKETGNPPGNPTPSFQPGDEQMAPIPEGYTASIILSNAMLQSFLAKQFSANGFVSSFQTVPLGGIVAQLTKDSSIVAADFNGKCGYPGAEFDGLNISMNDYPMGFSIVDGQIGLTWSGKATSKWNVTYSGGGAAQVTYGEVDVTISLNKGPFAITVEDNKVRMPKIGITRGDFSITGKPHDCKFGESLIGCRETVPSFYSDDMNLNIPTLDLSFPGLDFFLESNLVSPGAPVITVDAQAGIQTPHDLVLVGNVIV